LRSALEQGLLLLTSPPSHVFFLPFPQLLFFLFASSLPSSHGFHFHYIFLHGISIFLPHFSSYPFSCEFFVFLHMLSTKNIFHSRMWPCQIDVTIIIIVSNECLWDNYIVPSN
jgi:hypothetical protein